MWIQSQTHTSSAHLHSIPNHQGLNILIPIIDQIKYVQSLKEKAIDIPSQSAISEGRWIQSHSRWFEFGSQYCVFLTYRQCNSTSGWCVVLPGYRTLQSKAVCVYIISST